MSEINFRGIILELYLPQNLLLSISRPEETVFSKAFLLRNCINWTINRD